MSDNLVNQPEDPEVEDWSRRQFLIGAGGALAVGAAALAVNSHIGRFFYNLSMPAVQKGLIHVHEADFYFLPNKMTWRVGDRITIKQHNESVSRYHEMQIGRGFDSVQTLLGTQRQQFKTDFWDGVHVTILDAHAVDNLVTHHAIVKCDVSPHPWLLTGPGLGNFSPTLEPGGWVMYEFTVPDKPGIWHYGCFVQGYIHYEEGMKGTIHILPA
ncbi:MAG: hypothetical protein OWQ59_11425 [Alicyclobacillaceae bacterium]|jgi:plastocyanin|uniref:hypothetical protein n=1 Tax=Alicyclobacillus sp. SP_1 TaxID=2942475 RepID=UPI0021572608|nr:hypothetical protein [Alicyclobacillus sp. SP_1]MCY0889052.1 hypothetical protein [Alicyclobacillaceae bacterium]MCY0894858.1 hypothetical protein [Alicyclobacillaceae bacterium]